MDMLLWAILAGCMRLTATSQASQPLITSWQPVTASNGSMGISTPNHTKLSTGKLLTHSFYALKIISTIKQNFMELTKEHFEKHLEKGFSDLKDEISAKFATKKDLSAFATKKDLNNRLNSQTIELKAFTRSQIGELARMVKHGFDHVDEQLVEISTRLDVREKIKQMDKKFDKLEDVLHIKL
jgi:hypothetical protein